MNKARGGDGISAKLFQILKDDAVKVGTGLEKVSFHSNPKDKQCQIVFKLTYNCVQGVCQAVYCHPAYLTYMQSISCKMLGWMKHKMESRLLGEISISSDMR